MKRMTKLSLLMLAAASTFCSSDAYCFNKNQETFYDVNSKNFNNSPPNATFSYRIKDNDINLYNKQHNDSFRWHNNSYRPTYPKAYTNGFESDSFYAPVYSDFSYRVNKDYKQTSDHGSRYNNGQLDYGHSEIKNGDRSSGSYDVVLPDGRRQIVTYYINGNSGFVADVKYEPAR